jgi:hypothetical protein
LASSHVVQEKKQCTMFHGMQEAGDSTLNDSNGNIYIHGYSETNQKDSHSKLVMNTKAKEHWYNTR